MVTPPFVAVMSGSGTPGAGRQAFIQDPSGNIVELNQGYVDEDSPPALPE